MARMLAQLETPSSPPPLTQPSAQNSCSTCSSPPDLRGQGWPPLLGGDGVQVFVGAGAGVDEELVEAEVRMAVRDELCHMIKELSGKQGCNSISRRYTSCSFFIVSFILLLVFSFLVILVDLLPATQHLMSHPSLPPSPPLYPPRPSPGPSHLILCCQQHQRRSHIPV